MSAEVPLFMTLPTEENVSQFQGFMQQFLAESESPEPQLTETDVVPQEQTDQELPEFDQTVYQVLYPFISLVQPEKVAYESSKGIEIEVAVQQQEPVHVEPVEEQPTAVKTEPTESVHVQASQVFPQENHVKPIESGELPPDIEIPTVQKTVVSEVTRTTQIPLEEERSLDAQSISIVPTNEVPVAKTIEVSFSQPEAFVREVAQTIEVTLPTLSAQQTSEVKVVQVTLTPETLGEMNIQLEWHGEEIEAKIFVQKEEVKQVLEQHLTKLIEHLPQEPVVQAILIEVLPQQPVLAQWTGDFQSRKQPHVPNSKQRYHGSSQSSDEESGESEGSIYHTKGLSLYI